MIWPSISVRSRKLRFAAIADVEHDDHPAAVVSAARDQRELVALQIHLGQRRVKLRDGDQLRMRHVADVDDRQPADC